MRYFDALTWIGRWPFAFLTEHDARSLEAHLRARKIRRALVSPLDAVLQPEPGLANRRLLADTRGVRSLVPVPIVNPALANWRDELDACCADPRVRAVRILPNYHGYRPIGRTAAELAVELVRRNLRLIVQVRLVDERHEFHAMTIKGVRIAEIDAMLSAHPALKVLVSGLLRQELFTLSGKYPRMLADLAFVEWHKTLVDALENASTRQLVMASHTPFLVTAASRAKLESSGLSARVCECIASTNLKRWLEE